MLPKLHSIPNISTISTDSFRGLNITQSYQSGELIEDMNTDSREYPAVTTRPKRAVIDTLPGNISGIGTDEELYCTYCNEDKTNIFLYYNGESYEFTEFTSSDDFTAKRYFALCGEKILIIPDKITFDISNLCFEKAEYSQSADYNDANRKFRGEAGIYYELYNANAYTELGNVTHNSISSVEFTYVPGSYREYEFYPIAFADDIKVGDMIFVKLSVKSSKASAGDEYNQCIKRFSGGVWLKVKNKVIRRHGLVNGSYIDECVSLEFDDNSLDIMGLSDMQFTNMSIERTMPDLKKIISCNNRIWGIAGEKVYSSKLGEADEWNDYSVDIYGTLPASCFSAVAGTPGDFTDIIQHGNYIYVFKENYIHKIYGDTPDEYAFSNMEAIGVCVCDTLAVCGNYLMYASFDGVYILKDGYPRLISRRIGRINPICAEAYQDKYYIICQNDDNKIIYVYDMSNDLWHIQNCSSGAGNIYSDSKNIVMSDGNRIILIQGKGEYEYEDNIPWKFKLRFDRNKFVNMSAIKSVIRLSLSENTVFNVQCVYDDGTFGSVCQKQYQKGTNGRCVLRLPIKRDLGFCVEFSGVGDFVLRNIQFSYYNSFEE